MEVSLPTDSDGFLSQECPSCERRFKVLFGHGSEEPISFCLYCGHNGKDCWHTKEQLNYFESVAVSAFILPELQKLKQQLANNSSNLINVGLKIDAPDVLSPPMEADDDLEIVQFPCCGETVKSLSCAKLFCIICGKEVDMDASEKKKGISKP